MELFCGRYQYNKSRLLKRITQLSIVSILLLNCNVLVDVNSNTKQRKSLDKLLVQEYSQPYSSSISSQNYCYNYSEIGQYDDNYGFCWSPTIEGDYLYAANGFGGLFIFDITTPTSPVLLSHVCDGGTAFEAFVEGDYAFLADGEDGLEIYDVSDKTNPIEIGGILDGGSARGIYVVDDYAFVASKGTGLEIINIDDKTAPKRVGLFHDGEEAQSIFVKDGYAFVFDRYDNLEIIVIDSDLDGLVDGEEIHVYNTDPYDKDTDDDEFSDYEEILARTDPLNPKSNPQRRKIIYLSIILPSIILSLLGTVVFLYFWKLKKKVS